jgi:hypothetical protein
MARQKMRLACPAGWRDGPIRQPPEVGDLCRTMAGIGDLDITGLLEPGRVYRDALRRGCGSTTPEQADEEDPGQGRPSRFP